MKNRTAGAVAGLLLGAALAASHTAMAQAPDPIAFIGHGVMFDAAGRPIAPTPTFIERAQNHYIERLSARLQPAQKSAFSAERARHLETTRRLGTDAAAADPQAALVVNAALIDWLIKAVPTADSGALASRNNLMKARLRQRLFPPQVGTPYSAPPEMLDLLKSPPAGDGRK